MRRMKRAKAKRGRSLWEDEPRRRIQMSLPADVLAHLQEYCHYGSRSEAIVQLVRAHRRAMIEAQRFCVYPGDPHCNVPLEKTSDDMRRENTARNLAWWRELGPLAGEH